MNVGLLMWLCICVCWPWAQAKMNGKNPQYSNVWIAHIEGGEDTAHRVARETGFAYNGQVKPLKEYYKFKRVEQPDSSLHHSEHLTRDLLEIKEVKWAKQQLLIKLVPLEIRLSQQYIDEANEENFIQFVKHQSKQNIHKEDIFEFFWTSVRFPFRFRNYLRSLKQGNLSKLGSFSTKPAPPAQLDTYRGPTQNFGLLSRKVSAYAIMFNDPFWRRQWYMQDYRTTDVPVLDHNIVPAWNMGYTGKKVTVAILDDGIEDDHPDLKDSIARRMCYDICKTTISCNPIGKGLHKKSHGTRCAGVIAMKPNNKVCGVGIAYDATIVGIRMLCENPILEETNLKALTHYLDEIDIYSSSWSYGGYGTGLYVLDEMSRKGYELGASEGRGGKGSIYLHSGGNGRDEGDNCAVDPNINQPYVIAIAAASQWGKAAWYSERCAALMATVYSHNEYNEGIVSTHTSGGCTRWFGGTSSTAPQAAGVIALALQANPRLTYRDVMHLIVMTAEVAPLANNKGTWIQNGRGFWVSNDFGFGLMNAENMVTLGRDWQIVPERHTCVIPFKLEKPKHLSKQHPVSVPFDTSACGGSRTDEVNFLEHVEIASIVKFPYRGHIIVDITSPAGNDDYTSRQEEDGTKFSLLQPREKDDDLDGLEGWSIMSTRTWGENPSGRWTIDVSVSDKSKIDRSGQVKEFMVKFHGTAEMPFHYQTKRTYAAFRLPD